MPTQNTLTQHKSSLGTNSRHQRNRGGSTQKQQGEGCGHRETFYVDQMGYEPACVVAGNDSLTTSLPGKSSRRRDKACVS